MADYPGRKAEASLGTSLSHTVVQSYLSVMSASSGRAAAERKTAKYTQLAQTYTLIPIAVDALGQVNSVGLQFLSKLGRGTSLKFPVINAGAPSSSVCQFLSSILLRTISSHSSLAFISI